jgi:hypothetical protein
MTKEQTSNQTKTKNNEPEKQPTNSLLDGQCLSSYTQDFAIHNKGFNPEGSSNHPTQSNQLSIWMELFWPV